MARFEPIDPTVPRWDANAPADVRADAEHGAIRGKQGALAAGGTASGVRD